MSLEKEIKEFKTILKNTKKESNPNPFEQRLLRKVIKLIQELQTAKEENEKLKKVADIAMKMKVTWDEFDKVNESEINTLTQQNKQMRENINNIKNLCNEDWEDMTVDKFQNQLLQALKGVE